MRARITPDDLAAGTLVDPAWYPCRISAYKEVPAGTDGSTNGIVTMIVADGKFKGARCQKLYNEKAMGMAGPFLKALGAKVDKDTGIDADMSEDVLVGKYLDVHIRRGETNKHNPFNEPTEFAPIGTITKFVPPTAAVK